MNNKPVIICVDDEPIILESLKIELKKALGEEHLLETAEGGEEALELIDELLEEGCEIVAVISDYLMPNIKGDELLKQIHIISPKTIKIMLTGQADLEAVANTIKYAKLYRYISKPWQSEDLKLTLKEAVNSYFMEKQLGEQNAQLQKLNQELETLVEERTAQLSLSEEKFAKAFRSSPNPITIARLKDGRYLEVNEAFCQTIGYSIAEIIDRTALDLNLWESTQARAKLFAMLDEQKIVRNYEFDWRTKTGELRTGLVSAEIIDIHGETCVISVIQDISDRKLAEEKLRALAASLAAAQRIARVGNWECDFSANTTTWSEELSHIFDLDATEAAPTLSEFAQYVHPDDRQKWQTTIDAAIASGQSYSLEYRILRPESTIAADTCPSQTSEGGSIRYIESRGEVVVNQQGQVTKLFTTLMDITARKLAEIALAESEEKYRHLVETSQDIIWSCDAQGHLTFVNQAVKQIYGYDPEEMLGYSFSDFLAPAQIDRNRELQQHLLTGDAVFQYESIVLGKDGRQIDVNTKAIARLDAAGNITGTTGTASDITERKQAEISLQKAKEEADRANRAKSEFLSNMSHELRTPLNAILGFTQLLARDAAFGSDQQQYLGIISRSGEHLLDLINNILQMSKIEVGLVTLNNSTFDLHRMLENTEDMLKLQAEKKGLQLICDAAPNLPQYVETDESKLRQVLINVVGNAIKFTAEGGVNLRIKHELLSNRNNEEIPPLAQPSKRIANCCLLFEVEDTGAGISAQEMDSLFKPFAQTESGKKAHEGTGLGLPISKQFVELMGGEMTVTSSVGNGSIFRFDVKVSLPNEVEIQVAQTTRRVVGLEPGQPEYRILAVDDRLESRLLLVRMLSCLGFTVRQAENGVEALSMWSSWEPHLIWMDMRMPVMDGYEATKQIKAHLKGQATVIIALTASAFDEERSVILSAGCDDFVAKPFREQVILEKMAKYLGVRYVYDREASLSSDAVAGGDVSAPTVTAPLPVALNSSFFEAMPPQWVDELYEAADSVDNEEIFRLLLSIPPVDAPYRSAIADLANNFRCDRIIDLIEEFRNV
ncbi:MAG: PAS domain S-box protein [Microcoleus sp. PH2017_40_RAT_O_B]|uniref:PAS domain S-box protein n=1 Tax=unclassified Microcoleus TaxID=2642155 RepID=UPI001DC429EE|nr:MULTISPECIES: PAS domain S-box protein [unclassified Microcoleus]MCC3575331.1 PAS domain S-box protein [Microcoleus sp. PH2017_34_RAT_O_A]MCC3612908.1 PAS domain S-box protein [Microcoleus sp. PH2017_40_RAT_O_B]